MMCCWIFLFIIREIIMRIRFGGFFGFLKKNIFRMILDVKLFSNLMNLIFLYDKWYWIIWNSIVNVYKLVWLELSRYILIGVFDVDF